MTARSYTVDEQMRLVKTIKGKVGENPMDIKSWSPELEVGWKRTHAIVNEDMTFEMTDVSPFQVSIGLPEGFSASGWWINRCPPARQ
jgi:hypothetical protein